MSTKKKSKKPRQKGNNPGELTAFCRTQLHECGVSYRSLKPDENMSIGAGVSILIANYKDRLINRCGFGNGDSSEKFMMARSMSWDTTADCYRCFTDEEGQHTLQLMLNRDARGEPVCTDREKLIAFEPWNDDGQKLVVRAGDLARFNCVTLEIELAENDVFLAYADGGLKMYIEDSDELVIATGEGDVA